MKKIIVAILAALSCLFLFACVPSNVEKAEEKMEKAGYTVLAYSDKEAEGLVGGFIATKGLIGGESLTAVLFETVDDAKAFAEEIGSKAKRDGKWVYYGTEAAIKAFEK